MHDKALTFSVIAFGAPSSPTTFSGLSASLVRAIQSHGLLRNEYNIKPRRLFDLVRSVSLYDAYRARFRPHISREWMWSRAGVELMSRNLAKELRANADDGPLLQVGTLVRAPGDGGPHFMITDMTIPQARRAGQFAIARMSDRSLDAATRLQAERLAEAAHVFTICQWTADSIVSDFSIDADKVTVVYPGSNLALPDGLDEPKRPHEVLFVGIDWVRKGGPLLLEAFRIVRQQIPDATLTVVGCSPVTRDLGVIIEGYLSRSDPAQFVRLARCYMRAACFCLPSVFDPFPNAIIEAASAGLPSIAIDNGSRREAIVDGVTGQLASEATAESLASAIVRVISDREASSAMGAAAMEYVVQRFTWDRAVETIRCAARSALDRTQGSRKSRASVAIAQRST